MKDRSFFLLGLAGLVFVCLPTVFGAEVRSETEIDITQGTVEPSPIAITDFHGVDEATLILGAEISEVDICGRMVVEKWFSQFGHIDVASSTTVSLCKIVRRAGWGGTN